VGSALHKHDGDQHVVTLRLHGARVDVMLHDSLATVAFDPVELARIGVESVSRPLAQCYQPAVHDPDQLGSALAELTDL
jgi:hypothetical protein